MPNLALPNPAQQSDINAALLAAVAALALLPPVVVVAPLVPASTNYTYIVVARVNGAVVPGTKAITNGAATLTLTAANALSWNPVPGANVVYDVYRTQGGVAQGQIAAGLTATSLLDTGLVANTALTAPPFNTSGTLAGAAQEPIFVAAASGAIPIVSGTVMITKSTAAALTLALPIAGPASAGGHDGCVLNIIGVSAHAHTVTTPANGINGADDTATYAAAGDIAVFIAYNGGWIVPLAPLTAMLSEV